MRPLLLPTTLMVLSACLDDEPKSENGPVDSGGPTHDSGQADGTDGADGADGTDGTDGGTDGGESCEPPEPSSELQRRFSRYTAEGERVEPGVLRWRGLPFASPPVGELRFAPPAEPACETDGVRAAIDLPPACPQMEEGTLIGEEDCLYLNVWAPEDATGAPVLVFLHGGGHEQGSLSVDVEGEPLYDGAAFARAGVVFVAAQYRLGALGFLAHPDLASATGGNGNWGTLDQLAALAWVQDNVVALGGDPGVVTLFGQSAGSVSTCRVASSPLAEGLLHQVILMSGSCVGTELEDALLSGEGIAAEFACTDATDVGACLRAVPVEELVPATSTGVSLIGTRRWNGTIDGVVVPTVPRDALMAGHFAADRLIIGATSAETAGDIPAVGDAAYPAAIDALLLSYGIVSPTLSASLEDLYPLSEFGSAQEALVQLTSDAQFVCPATWDLEAARLAGLPAWRYHWDERLDRLPADDPRNQPAHGTELLWLFDRQTLLGALLTADEDALGDAFQSDWVMFAAMGVLREDWEGWQPETDIAWRYTSPAGEPLLGVHSERCEALSAIAEGFGG